jgi:hypothetical protein
MGEAKVLGEKDALLRQAFDVAIRTDFREVLRSSADAQ